MDNYFLNLMGKRVKVKYLDEETTCVIKGILNEANDQYIVVNDVVVGLGKTFISCIPQEEKYG